MDYIYDTHYHLDLQKDRFSAVREIEEKQIYTIAVTNLPDLYRREISEVSSKYIRLALGFHPELVHEYKNQIPLMWDLLPNARYIGEVGLDFTDKAHQKEQMDFFSELVERCRFDRNKIFTIHSRKAVGKVLEILGDNYRFKAILHWFTGSKRELSEAIEKGCYFSINSAMVKSNRFLEMLPLIPSNRLLLETDSPFINYDGVHSDALHTTMDVLKSVNLSVEPWDNFKSLLDRD